MAAENGTSGSKYYYIDTRFSFIQGFLLKLGPVVFVLNYIFTNIELIGSGSQTLLHVTLITRDRKCVKKCFNLVYRYLI